MARSAVFPCLSGSLLMSGAMALSAAAQNAPGVTDREIKIGQTMPYTGPGARFSANGLAEMAYMKMINDQGGINGRKISLISVDDGFMPWRTGNETRKLMEVEQVAFVFGSIGTTTQLSVAKYLNERKIPQLFIESGAYRWGRYKDTPYTIGGVRPSYRLGARLYVRHMRSSRTQMRKSASFTRTMTGAATIPTACATCWAPDMPRPCGKRPTSSRMPRSTGRSSSSRPPAAMR